MKFYKNTIDVRRGNDYRTHFPFCKVSFAEKGHHSLSEFSTNFEANIRDFALVVIKSR